MLTSSTIIVPYKFFRKNLVLYFYSPSSSGNASGQTNEETSEESSFWLCTYDTSTRVEDVANIIHNRVQLYFDENK